MKRRTEWWRCLHPVHNPKKDELQAVQGVLEYLAHHLDRHRRRDELVLVGRILRALELAIRRGELAKLDKRIVSLCSMYLDKCGGMTDEDVAHWSKGTDDKRKAQLRVYLCHNDGDSMAALLHAAERMIRNGGLRASTLALETETALKMMGIDSIQIDRMALSEALKRAKDKDQLNAKKCLNARCVVGIALEAAGLSKQRIKKLFEAHRGRTRRGSE